MRRIRWFHSDSDSQPDNGWYRIALFIATVFLNIVFVNGRGVSLWLFCPLPAYAVLAAAVALLITALLFVGPALAFQSTRKPLFGLIEESLGSVPTVCYVSALSYTWYFGFLR